MITKATPAEPSYDWLEELNDQQRQAVTVGDGPILVIAGAGTGKTKTLAYRVAYLVSRNVDPASILLMTFTRRAAQEMLNRAAGIMRHARTASADCANRVWGGTFHSIANRLLRIYADTAGLGKDFTVMDQSDARDLMNLVRAELGYRSKKKRFPRKATLLDIYSYCVNGPEPLEDVLARQFPWCAEWEPDLGKIFSAYEEAKAARNVLDYDDLLGFWARLLENDAVAASMCDRFRHVLVDEYQDTNSIQAYILRRLRVNNPNLLVVGDDAQSIYSFRSARVENILEFPDQFSDTRVVKLEQNYRSTRPILDASNSVIADARRQYDKKLWSKRPGRQRPRLVTLIDEPQQTEYLIERILEHLEAGVPLQRQAVLFRTSHWSDQLEVELNRRNIPYHKFGGLKFLEAAHVKDLIAFLRVLENPRDQVAWYRLLNLLEGVGPSTARAVYEDLRAADFLHVAIRTTFTSKIAARSLTALAGLLEELSRPRMADQVVAQIAAVREFYQPILERIHDNAAVRARDLEQLEAVASQYRSRQQFLTDLTLDPPISTSDLAGPPALDEDWLVLSTIHSAKGCEWDVVYLIHATDGILPSDLCTGDEELIEEERRLLYVAMTRAKDHLYVTMPLRYYVKKHKRGDAHDYAQLTRFIGRKTLRLFDRVELAAREQAVSSAEALPVLDVRTSLRRRWA